MSWTELHNVHKFCRVSTTHKIERSLKGVWGLSPLGTKKVVTVFVLKLKSSKCYHFCHFL